MAEFNQNIDAVDQIAQFVVANIEFNEVGAVF